MDRGEVNESSAPLLTKLAESTVLIVDPELAGNDTRVLVLAEMGFRVVHARTFLEAKTELLTRQHALLVAAIRLGEYNGLHLVLHARTSHTNMPALVTSPVADVVLAAEAEHLGATYVVMPAGAADITAAVARTLARAGASDPPICPPFERRQADRRVASAPLLDRVDRRCTERRVRVPDLIATKLSVI